MNLISIFDLGNPARALFVLSSSIAFHATYALVFLSTNLLHIHPAYCNVCYFLATCDASFILIWKHLALWIVLSQLNVKTLLTLKSTLKGRSSQCIFSLYILLSSHNFIVFIIYCCFVIVIVVIIIMKGMFLKLDEMKLHCPNLHIFTTLIL